MRAERTQPKSKAAALPWAAIVLPLRGATWALRRWFVPSPRSLHEVPASKGPPLPEPSEFPRGFGVRQCSAALGVGESLRKRQSTAALQDAGAHAQARAGSGAQSASKHPGLLIHKLSHWPFSYASDTVVQAENMTTSLTPAVALPHTTRVR